MGCEKSIQGVLDADYRGDKSSKLVKNKTVKEVLHEAKWCRANKVITEIELLLELLLLKNALGGSQ